ncbi:urease accessory protein UreF [Actinokineospora iranica]|uniref:Urease accessory protein n=1 Tax=Actinokineospora iranica TaxID=1271860 RepID=A0A1G6S695_9PSEU|nr:urease accessory UreF family protein [Actinokineospora iranica]SDD11685.1 urease accessory protein [Actinokineospora iranica]
MPDDLDAAGAAAILSLVDSRFPGGGHAHSGGLEEAAARGLVTDPQTLAGFLRGRLHTAGALAAVFAAAAAHTARNLLSPPAASRADTNGVGEAEFARATGNGHGSTGRRQWTALDAELDARTPSPAQRAASRAQGSGMARAGRSAWPSPVLDGLLAATPRPHQPVLLGALAGIAGASPTQAALAALYLAVSGPASASTRLLGLDPFEVNAAVVALSAPMSEIAAHAAQTCHLRPADLPAPSAPALDLMAEAHDRTHRMEVRLFAS